MGRRSSAASTLLALILCISTSESIVFKKEHSFAAPFEGQTDIFRNWYFTGAASLHEGFVRLTAAEPMTQGAIWCSHATFMKDWEIQVHFRIFGKEAVNYGDGIGIWYTKEGLHSGPVFGNKDQFTGLGIFIDTQNNETHPHQHQHPYVSAMVNDGTLNYEHDEHGTVHQLGGCSIRARNQPPNIPTAIAISYIQNVLTVFTDTEGLMQWVPCFRAENVHLPSGYFFGVSASTSWLTDFHDIMTVSTLDMTALDSSSSDGGDSNVYQDVQQSSDNLDALATEDLVVPGEVDRIMQEVPQQQLTPEEQLFREQKHDHHQQQQQHMDQDFGRMENVFDRQKRDDDHHQHHQQQQQHQQQHQQQQHQQQQRVSTEEKHEEKVIQEEPAAKMSWLKLIMYTAMITIIGFLAIRWFSGYNARRKEKLRKRLY